MGSPGDLGAESNYVHFIFDTFLQPLSVWSAPLLQQQRTESHCCCLEQTQLESGRSGAMQRQGRVRRPQPTREPACNGYETPNFCFVF